MRSETEMKNAMLITTALAAAALCADAGQPRENERGNNMEELKLTSEWDKVFPKSDKVGHRKATFKNRYGITLAADVYAPKSATGKLPAIAVCGPFGAVKEQSSGLYAQTMAERGFLAIAFDPSYTGESGGSPRYVASPDINTEDFCAAVDFLSNLDGADPERIGIIGICGWGGMALNAAAVDTRIKATVTSTMYDMSRVTANGYFDSMDAGKRDELRVRFCFHQLPDLLLKTACVSLLSRQITEGKVLQICICKNQLRLQNEAVRCKQVLPQFFEKIQQLFKQFPQRLRPNRALFKHTLK